MSRLTRCGVTVYDQADCEELIRRDLLAGESLPRVAKVIPDVEREDPDCGVMD